MSKGQQPIVCDACGLLIDMTKEWILVGSPTDSIRFLRMGWCKPRKEYFGNPSLQNEALEVQDHLDFCSLECLTKKLKDLHDAI